MFQFSISLNVCRYVSGIDGKKVAILMAFVFFMLIECNCLYGQDVVASQLNLPSLNILSPQTAEFVKHGNTPVSYFTGEANIRVPVYTYSDNDFELPIYLAYNSSGFNPNKRESIVGLNFFLNVGGAITRQVKGVPDERQGILSVSLRELHGGFYGYRSNLAVKNKSLNDIFNFQNAGEVDEQHFWHIENCEVDPDNFTFNVPGHSGSFFIENNGKVRVSGKRPFQVDLENFATQNYHGYGIDDSEITITTDDGYTYYFGGSDEYLEISYTLNGAPEQEPNRIDRAVIVAWHLRKIVAPNGRFVEFFYEDFTPGFYNDSRYPEDTKHYLLNVYNAEYSVSDAYCTDFQTWFNSEWVCSEGGSSGQSKTKEVTKTVYLKKISVGKTNIELFYSEKGKRFYPDDVSPFNQKNYQLNNIKVFYNGVTDPFTNIRSVIRIWAARIPAYS